MLTPEIHQLAVRNATIATENYIKQNGEHPFNCGFAWVTVRCDGLDAWRTGNGCVVEIDAAKRDRAGV